MRKTNNDTWEVAWEEEPQNNCNNCNPFSNLSSENSNV